MDFINSAASQYAKETLSVLQFKSLIDGSFVDFMAFLTSFNQSFNSNWTTETVYGRNDPIATFQGTIRSLNIAWNIPAMNLEEAQKNMGKVSSLVKMLYPSYTQGTVMVDRVPNEGEIGGDLRVAVGSNALSLSKNPLIRLKYANLINSSATKDGDGLLGYITSLSIDPTIDMGMFTSSEKIYPKVYSLS